MLCNVRGLTAFEKDCCDDFGFLVPFFHTITSMPLVYTLRLITAKLIGISKRVGKKWKWKSRKFRKETIKVPVIIRYDVNAGSQRTIIFSTSFFIFSFGFGLKRYTQAHISNIARLRYWLWFYFIISHTWNFCSEILT